MASLFGLLEPVDESLLDDEDVDEDVEESDDFELEESESDLGLAAVVLDFFAEESFL